jgi:uncharacterized membrane protein
MRLSNRTIILILVAITLLLFPVVILTSGILLVIVGLPVLLFIPGYILLAALFPDRDSLTGIERVTFSFGLSVAFSIIMGVILSFTPWGINPLPILVSATVFIVVTAAFAWYRSWQSYDEFSVTIDIDLYHWRQKAAMDKLLSVLLVIAVVAVFGALGYVIAVPKRGQPFTDFYILSPAGNAEDYPYQVMLGEAVVITIGLVNHEGMEMSYLVDITGSDIEDSQLITPELADSEKWEGVVSLLPQASGDQQKVEFWLYKAGQTGPYQEPLYIYFDVVEAPA